MVEIFALVVSGAAFVAAFFAWGENAFGNDFFGSKVKVKCFPTKPGLPKPFVMGNVVYLALSTPLVLGPARDEDSVSFLEFTTSQIVTIPNGYLGIMSIDSNVLPSHVFLEAKILPPGWSGEITSMIGNRSRENAASLPTGVHCIMLYVIKVGSPIRLKVRV